MGVGANFGLKSARMKVAEEQTIKEAIKSTEKITIEIPEEKKTAKYYIDGMKSLENAKTLFYRKGNLVDSKEEAERARDLFNRAISFAPELFPL
jgi:hypothetical protein